MFVAVSQYDPDGQVPASEQAVGVVLDPDELPLEVPLDVPDELPLDVPDEAPLDEPDEEPLDEPLLPPALVVLLPPHPAAAAIATATPNPARIAHFEVMEAPPLLTLCQQKTTQPSRIIRDLQAPRPYSAPG